MKIHSKYLVSLCLIASLSTIIALPINVSAATSAENTVFCKGLPAIATKITAAIDTTVPKYTTAQTTRDTNTAADRTKWDAELATERAKWDQQRLDSFVKIEAKATTPAQTAAIKTYETSIKSATAARRAANDKARTTYRTGIDAAIAAHRSTVQAQITTFKTATTQAIATATAACASTSKDGSAARMPLVGNLKNARTIFNEGRKEDTALAAQIKNLQAIKQTATSANDKAFLQATKTARDALKLAFPGIEI